MDGGRRSWLLINLDKSSMTPVERQRLCISQTKRCKNHINVVVVMKINLNNLEILLFNSTFEAIKLQTLQPCQLNAPTPMQMISANDPSKLIMKFHDPWVEDAVLQNLFLRICYYRSQQPHNNNNNNNLGSKEVEGYRCLYGMSWSLWWYSLSSYGPKYLNIRVVL